MAIFPSAVAGMCGDGGRRLVWNETMIARIEQASRKEVAMSDYRETGRDAATHTTIIEKRGGGGTTLIAIVLLLAVIVGGVYLYSVSQTKAAKDGAIAGAADSVSRAADKVGSAADNSH
jgi:hypothetical protein